MFGWLPELWTAVLIKPRTIGIFLLVLPIAAGAQSFTHVHLRAPDAAAAAEWYHTLLGGDLRPAATDMGSVGQAHGAIATMADDGFAAPSFGGAIDHFGFAVLDVARTLERAQIMGARLIDTPTPGVTTTAIAMIEDPWGTRIELLETPEFRGIQHVHFVTEDPAALTRWFLDIFGGDFDPGLGGNALYAIRYDGIWVYISEPPPVPTESDTAVLALEPFRSLDESVLAVDPFGTSESEAYVIMSRILTEIGSSRGRALDHFGLSVEDMDALVARIRASGYEPYEIRPNRPGGAPLLMFFEGAGGIHFEIAQPVGVEPLGGR